MNGIPIIKIEIEGMKESMQHALAVHNKEFDTMIRSAVAKAFNFETIQEKIDRQVDAALDSAISSISEDYQIKSVLRRFVLITIDKMNQELLK